MYCGSCDQVIWQLTWHQFVKHDQAFMKILPANLVQVDFGFTRISSEKGC